MTVKMRFHIFIFRKFQNALIKTKRLRKLYFLGQNLKQLLLRTLFFIPNSEAQNIFLKQIDDFRYFSFQFVTEDQFKQPTVFPARK